VPAIDLAEVGAGGGFFLSRGIKPVIRQYRLRQAKVVVMLAPISMDLRLRIVRAVERGSSIRAGARRFAVSRSAAIKLMQRVRATGNAAPERFGGHRRPVLRPTKPTSAGGASVALTTGTNDSSAAGSARRPCRAWCRHANSCCGRRSCQRATSEITPAGARLSATIRASLRAPPTPARGPGDHLEPPNLMDLNGQKLT
jgi:hypothetical protein